MGNKHARAKNASFNQLAGDLMCPICFDEHDIRGLPCGHFFCHECLFVIYQRHGIVTCPFDRLTADKLPIDLPTIQDLKLNKIDFILYQELLRFPHYKKRKPNFKANLSSSLDCRWTTIRILKDIATLVDSVELTGSKVQVGSLTACVVGGVAVTLGLGASITGIGASFGIPLIVGGTTIGGGGAIGSLATNVVEYISRKRNLKRINMRLQLDNFLSEQLLTMANRAKQDHTIATAWDLSFLNALGFACVLPNVAKIGVTSLAGVRTVAVVGSGVAKASLAGVGIVFSAAMIPIDIVQLVHNTLKVHSKTPSKLVDEIRNLAETLEVQLKLFYQQLDLFQLVNCYSRLPLPSIETPPYDETYVQHDSPTEHDECEVEDLLLRKGSLDDSVASSTVNKLFKINATEGNSSESEKIDKSTVNSTYSEENFVFVCEENENEFDEEILNRSSSISVGNSSRPNSLSSNGDLFKSMWLYMCIDPMFSDEFHMIHDLGDISGELLTYEKVKTWGRIIFQGMGDEPPPDVLDVVRNEWQVLYEPEMDCENIEIEESFVSAIPNSCVC